MKDVIQKFVEIRCYLLVAIPDGGIYLLTSILEEVPDKQRSW